MKYLFRALFLLSASFVAAFCDSVAPYANLDKGVLKIGNGLIERTFNFNEGNLETISIADKSSGKTIRSKRIRPDIFLPEENGKLRDAKFAVEKIAANKSESGFLKCTVEFSRGNLQIKRIFKIYPNTPAIRCEVFFKGTATAKSWLANSGNAADLKNVENLNATESKKKIPAIDSVEFYGKHWSLEAVEFFDVTDYNNTLVRNTNLLSYRAANSLRGNLLFAEDNDTNAGFFWLKHSPCSSVQLAYPNADFFAREGELSLVGIGLDAKDVRPDEWTRAYAYAFGTYSGGELQRLCALRRYQKEVGASNGGRDEMVMLNTWGDRGQDKKVNEQFCISGIELASKMGITHFQIDDGWQSGKSANSAFGGSFKNIWSNPDYWQPSKEKYPNGFKPVVEAAKNAGVELCLWFNPSVQNDYSDWQKDANAMNNMFDKYGVRTFKIDGVKIPNKLSEDRFMAILDTVRKHTNYEAVFNLDATAGRRGGYFMFPEYGNIFLENRYTDWGNYYPYWTLRNLWTLSKYVPAEKLQIEFLNNERNKAIYSGDIFAPANYNMQYLFAVSMFAQPLAWLEASGLSETQRQSLAPIIKKYNTIANEIHSGIILPIGDEPSGRSWTGFQSISGNENWILVFREKNSDKSKKIKLWGIPEKRLRLEKIIGSAKSFEALPDDDNRIEFTLPEENSFTLFRVTTE